MIVILCILAAIVQPLPLLLTNHISKSQFCGIVVLYFFILLIAAAAP